MIRMQVLFLTVILLCFSPQAGKGNNTNTIPIAAEQAIDPAPYDILFGDYKLFMIYTRDSIMREILSEELADFCMEYATHYECDLLDWNIPINLNHEEVVEILTNYSEYGNNFDFLIKENDDYFVDISYLIYRTERSDENGINLFPGLHKLDPPLQKNIEFRFGIYNNWNEILDGQIINKILSPRQIDAYLEWCDNIGLKKARKLTRSKVIKPGYSNIYGTR
jgi:hypothetical protein